MDEFERLLAPNRAALERFVRYRVPGRADADDVIQETLIAAYRAFDSLRDPASFKPWLMSIARNKARDWFRNRARELALPLDALSERVLTDGRLGPGYATAVSDTLERLGGRDQQILYLYYFRNLPQADIARRLGIPPGTVKSRLHTARRNFRDAYPRAGLDPKGAIDMDKQAKQLPELLPDYRITPLDTPPFETVWEELMGWFLVPRLGERLSWGMYDLPDRRMTSRFDLCVTGPAEVHGIEGVEITAREASVTDPSDALEHTFVAQLTDTHCRYLATTFIERGVRRYVTFLDGDAFMPNWGFGEDNCGNETHLHARGDIIRRGDVVTSVDKPFLLDIVGRYRVDICGRSYDTVCVMDIDTYNPGVASEQFIDRNGRTVLWRRYNRDDWAIERYGRRWSEQLPDSPRLTVNGATYVEWYECITDYAL